jgi:hypothetical protein
MRERGISFKEALNEAVRTRLLHDKQRRARKFEFRWDKVLCIAEAMEYEDRAGKLSPRK